MKWGPSHKIVRPIVFPFAAQIYSAILHTKQRQRWCTDPASLIMDDRHTERQPRRAALPISSVDSGERSVAARRSWAAPGLSSGRFVVAAAVIYLSPLCLMSACRFVCPNADRLCHVGDMSATCSGHVCDLQECRVGKGVQNDTTCRLFPTCRRHTDTQFSSNIKMYDSYSTWYVWADLNLSAVIEINWVCRGLFCVGSTRVSIGKRPTL